MTTHLTWYTADIRDMLRSQDGPVGRFLAVKGQRAQDDIVGKIHNRSGRYAASVRKMWSASGENLSILVYSDCPYAMFVEEDTEPHDIPNAFGWGPNFGIGGRFDGKFHPGTKGQHQFRDALLAAVK